MCYRFSHLIDFFYLGLRAGTFVMINHSTAVTMCQETTRHWLDYEMCLIVFVLFVLHVDKQQELDIPSLQIEDITNATSSSPGVKPAAGIHKKPGRAGSHTTTSNSQQPMSQIVGIKKPLSHTNSLAGVQVPKYGVDTAYEVEVGQVCWFNTSLAIYPMSIFLTAYSTWGVTSVTRLAVAFVIKHLKFFLWCRAADIEPGAVLLTDMKFSSSPKPPQLKLICSCNASHVIILSRGAYDSLAFDVIFLLCCMWLHA